MENKKLYKSANDKVLAGVCGGLGKYLGVDPVFVRLIWALIVLTTGVVPGVVAYIIAIYIIPEEISGAK